MISTEGIELTEDQQRMVQLVQQHLVLQDQFGQLTKHCEIIYTRLDKLEKLVAAKILS